MQSTIIKIRAEINKMEINKTKSRSFDKEKLNHIDKALLLYYLDVQRKTHRRHKLLRLGMRKRISIQIVEE